MNPAPLRPFMEDLAGRYPGRRDLESDPLALVTVYETREDREVAALVASALAYGRVDQIQRSARDVLRRMGQSPSDFVRSFDPARDAKHFAGWVHRFNRGEDIAALCWGLSRVYGRYDFLEGLFLEGHDPQRDSDVLPALEAMVRRLLAIDYSPVYGVRGLPEKAGLRWFFPLPSRGSACKRLHLFLRWMVRTGSPDFGDWTGVDPAHLLIPLDTHVARISRYLGLSTRRTPDRRMAVEITEGLRRLDPRDPVRFDWAISRLGILKDCPRQRHVVNCRACALFPVCQASGR